jgi:hypothetical protein
MFFTEPISPCRHSRHIWSQVVLTLDRVVHVSYDSWCRYRWYVEHLLVSVLHSMVLEQLSITSAEGGGCRSVAWPVVVLPNMLRFTRTNF